MLPTFIIAGASKSGSTSLWMYVKEHPEICMTTFREPRFFSNEPGFADGGGGGLSGPYQSGRFQKGLEWYQSLFRFCDVSKAVGEISLSYMSAVDAPGLMRQIIPKVKLLFILRDPVDRLYSHYWEERKQGWDWPEFEVMLEEQHPRFRYYMYVSSYHLHLARYFEIFPKEQIFIFLYEDMRLNPQKFMREVYQAIGVEPDYQPESLETRFNPAGRVKSAWFQRLLRNHAIMTMSMDLPPWLYNWLGEIRRKLVALNMNIEPYPPLRRELRQQLVAELTDGIEHLEKYLDRVPTSWRKA